MGGWMNETCTEYTLCIHPCMCTVKSQFNESRFNEKSPFKVWNFVTKMKFLIKKSRCSLKSQFKEWKGADGGHSLNRDFTILGIETYFTLAFKRATGLDGVAPTAIETFVQFEARGTTSATGFFAANHRHENRRVHSLTHSVTQAAGRIIKNANVFFAGWIDWL